MRPGVRWWMVLLAVGSVALVGCGADDEGAEADGDGGTPTAAAPAAVVPALVDLPPTRLPSEQILQDQSTPRAALAKMLQAWGNFDREQYLASIDATEEEKRGYANLLDLARAGAEFHRAGIEAYGEDAWREAFGTGGVEQPRPAADVLADVEDLPIVEEGDAAQVAWGGQEAPIHMVRRDGQWYVQPEQWLGPAGVDNAATRAIAQTQRQVQAQIGQPGTTAQGIRQAYEQAMAQALMRMSSGD